MLIIDPVAFGDVACTRASTKMVYDRTGTLVSVPVNTLAVTYDPSDLTKAPYVLYEPVAATNFVGGSETLTSGWAGAAVAPSSLTYYGLVYQTVSKALGTSNENRANTFGAVPAGADRYYEIALRAGSSSQVQVGLYDAIGGGSGWGANAESVGVILYGPGTITQSTGGLFSVTNLSATEDTLVRIKRTYQIAAGGAAMIYPDLSTSTTAGASILATRVQVTDTISGYIPTTTAPVTRAADVIAPGAGLAYSNVAITETPYSAGATFASGAQVYDPATYAMYQSLVAGNVGNALSDTTKWTPLVATVINRRKLLDQYNNTQTSNAEEILMVLSPQAIAQGLFLANVDGSEVRWSVVDLSEGLVYSETQSLIVSNSGSSFYNWCFKRIQKRTYAVSVALPPYANALVTIAIRKPGGTAKCGTCALGPLVDVGLSQYGLSREIKDYSTINFNFDGTSNQVIRNFAKRMDLDIVIDNSQIDFVIETLEGYRQKPVAWIGAKEFGSACLFGRYSSFKNVVESFPQSKMNLQIEGTV
jgi:hypothetical protein